MGFLRGVHTMILLLFSIGIVPLLGAQDMDTLEGVYREQYEQLTAQENMLQEQIDNLTNMKAQVDSLIGQVGDIPAVDYAQEADRYRQLELLLPSATRYTQELARRQKQLTELQQQKTDLRSRILERQSSLPIWWRQ